MRGYANNSLTPKGIIGTSYDYIGASLFDKYTLEMRYPISLNPQATVYALVFAEGGNAWNNFRSFDPFNLHRSAGAGVRIFLPIFGTLGLDWGYGFDKVQNGSPSDSGPHFHFSINQSIDN